MQHTATAAGQRPPRPGETVHGGCNCGAVRFEGVLSGRGIGVCHCRTCRRQASGPWLALRLTSGVRLSREDGLTWWRSSDTARRGFCGRCGATLFFAPDGAGESDWAVSAGALDADPRTEIFEHIFVDAAPDYYGFTDTAPRRTAQDLGA